MLILMLILILIPQPLGASTSDIAVINSTDTEGTINITISDTALQVPDGSRSAFSQFSKNITIFHLPSTFTKLY